MPTDMFNLKGVNVKIKAPDYKDPLILASCNQAYIYTFDLMSLMLC